MGTNTLHYLLSRQLARRLNNRPLAVQPRRLYRIEPRTLHRQTALQDANPALALHLPIVGADPTTHLLANVPGGIVPDQHPDPLALKSKPLKHPFEKRD